MPTTDATRKIEILVFDGCPNAEPARALVERVTREVGVPAAVEVVLVLDEEAAERARFLGSPTIRVDGEDIEPGAERRADYVFSCRVYRTAAGLTGQPDENWLRQALTGSGR